MSGLFGRGFRRAGAVGIGAAAALIGAGMLAQAAATRRDEQRYPAPGELVDVGGRRLHARTMGTGQTGPTVVFENGLGCPLESWGWIQPAVAEHAPTLTYDRAGLGASDPGPRPRTAASTTEDLQRLLAVLGLPTPYVLVGHSIGGLLVRHFAATYPEQVGGMVLVDSSHPDQLQRSSRQWLGLPLMRAHLQGALINATVGATRKTGRYLAAAGIDQLPEADRLTARARMLSFRVNRAAYAELNGWLEHINDEVRDSQLPSDTPLAVVTAGAVADDDPIHHELQAELAQLSLKGSHQVVADAEHLHLVMSKDHAGAVADAITGVVSAVR